MSDRRFFLTLQAIRRQLAGMPNDFYFLRLIHGSTHRPAPGERLWTAGELRRATVVRFLRARNYQGFNVYLLPYAGPRNAGYIFLDLDQPRPHILEAMWANGHEPCVVLQSSPGHLLAWVRVSTSGLEPVLATAVGKLLAQTYGGDLASTDWCHLGRLAGFTNQKSQRRTASGFAPWVRVVDARAILASAAQDLLHAAAQAVTRAATDFAPRMISPTFHLSNSATITAQGAARVYRTWSERWHVYHRFPHIDWSIVDLWLARKLLTMHVSPAQTEAIIRLGSPGFPRRLVKMTLEDLQLIEQQIGQLDQEIASLLRQHQDAVERLAEVPGLGVDSAQQIIAEVGAKAATFASAKDLSSWVGACPGEEETAGVNYSPRSPKGNRQMRRILNQCANAAVKHKGSIFEILYRRLVPRLGHNKTIGAIAHRLCRLIWIILHKGVRYEERGPAVSEKSRRARTVRMIRTLRNLGYRVEPLGNPA